MGTCLTFPRSDDEMIYENESNQKWPIFCPIQFFSAKRDVLRVPVVSGTLSGCAAQNAGQGPRHTAVSSEGGAEGLLASSASACIACHRF